MGPAESDSFGEVRPADENEYKYTYTCTVCGAEKTIPMAWVRKRSKDPQYCSRDCKLDDKRETRVCDAPDCDTEFEVPQWKDKKFCSMDCVYGNRSTDQKARVELSCEVCGDEFEVHPSREESACYCSDSCRHKSQEESKIVQCKHCGEEIETDPSVDRTFCSYDCMYSYRVGENHPGWEGGSASFYGQNWHIKREEALDRDGHACVVCGAGDDSLSQNPDVHHIQPIRKFERLEDANVLDNLITLCRACHARWEGIPLRPQTGLDS